METLEKVWHAKGVQPLPESPPAKHEITPQLPPYQTKIFWVPPAFFFFFIFPGTPLLERKLGGGGGGGCLPWQGVKYVS